MDATVRLEPVAWVRGGRRAPEDDGWDGVTARLELAARFGPESVAGLDLFSHLEVVFVFDRVAEADVVSGARRPRGRSDLPEMGIFAQRGKARPNRLGVSVCRLERVEGMDVHVRGLDAIDGTPVLDIKPVITQFLPRGEIRQPPWVDEVMADYWEIRR